MANSQRTLELDQAKNAKATAETRIQELFAQEVLQKQQANIAKENELKELSIIEKRYELLNAEIKANNQFLEKQGELINGLVKANAAITGVDVLPSDLVQPGQVAELDLTGIRNFVTLSKAAIENNFETQKALIGETTKLAVAESNLRLIMHLRL